MSDIQNDPSVVKLIPLDIARKFKVIAITKLNKNLLVAISDPNNIYVLDAIKFITGCTVQPVISPEKAIEKAIDDIKAGKVVIVVDDENRENEGDLVMAASQVFQNGQKYKSRTIILSSLPVITGH